MSDPPSRYPNLRPNPEKLGVTPLGAGEVSRPVRVRASVEVHAWLGTMSAAQVGDVLARAKATQENAQGAAGGPAGDAGSRGPQHEAEAAQEAAEAVTLGTLPPMGVEPKPHHEPILQTLRAGGSLTRAPGGVWRLVEVSGRAHTIKPATVRVLLRDGWLERVEPEEETI